MYKNVHYIWLIEGVDLPTSVYSFFIHQVWNKASSVYNIASVVSPNIYTVIKYEAINNIRFGVICYFRSNTCSTHTETIISGVAALWACLAGPE